MLGENLIGTHQDDEWLPTVTDHSTSSPANNNNLLNYDAVTWVTWSFCERAHENVIITIYSLHDSRMLQSMFVTRIRVGGELVEMNLGTKRILSQEVSEICDSHKSLINIFFHKNFQHHAQPYIVNFFSCTRFSSDNSSCVNECLLLGRPSLMAS